MKITIFGLKYLFPFHYKQIYNVLLSCPAKSDSDDMFCLQSYKGLRIDRSLVYLSYPQDRINTHEISRFALSQVECTR